MRKLLPLSALLLLPATAFALNYTDVSGNYDDAGSFTKAERAAVSVLTNLDAVEGNPDGTFRPRRTLNRAEFLKIAILSAGYSVDMSGDWCFPDVRKEDWFSPYVCWAKRENAVQGYADGLFHPEREVNYVEAIKILVYLHDLNSTPSVDDQWYVPYLRVATELDLDLPEAPRFSDFITRGQMARMAASFRAFSDGELETYRKAEKGEWVMSSSSSSSMSSMSSSMSGSSVSSMSSSSSMSSMSSVAGFSLPAKNRLTLVDRVSPPFADATFTQTQEMLVREARVTLVKKVKSMSDMYLTDAAGNVIGTMRLDSTDETDEKWYVNFDLAASPKIPANQATTFALTGKLRPWGTGGVSGETIQVERMSLVVQSADGTSSMELLPGSSNFAKVQTAQTLLSKIKNAGDATGTLQTGSNKVIGAFSFSGTLLPGTSVIDLSQITARLVTEGAAIASPTIGRAGTPGNPCGLNGAMIVCTSLPTDARDASKGITLELRATVTRTGDGAHTLQVLLDDPGATDRPGAVQWSDGTTTFTWSDWAQPIASGTAWAVVEDP